jgi:hypothetical protein
MIKKRYLKGFFIAGSICLILYLLFIYPVFSGVIEEGNRTYIVDHTGERWDVTQAKSIGFEPEKFQFGIGRYAFTPLDDSYWSKNTDSVPESHRVIGISEGEEAQAYSVPTLSRH